MNPKPVDARLARRLDVISTRITQAPRTQQEARDLADLAALYRAFTAMLDLHAIGADRCAECLPDVIARRCTTNRHLIAAFFAHGSIPTVPRSTRTDQPHLHPRTSPPPEPKRPRSPVTRHAAPGRMERWWRVCRVAAWSCVLLLQPLG